MLRETLTQGSVGRKGAHVKSDRIVPPAERPHVKMANGDHAWKAGDDGAHGRHRQVMRRRFEQDQAAVEEDTERACDEDRGHQEARDRVGRGRPTRSNDETRYESGDGSERVAQHVQPSASQVERVTVLLGGVVRVGMATNRVVKKPSAAPVDEEGHEGEKKHDAGPRRGAFAKGVNGLSDDQSGRHENQERPRHGGHRFRPAKPIGEPRSRLANGDPHGQEVRPQGEDVGQEMQRVGLEHYALGPDGSHELDDEEAGDQPDHEAETRGLMGLTRGEAAGAGTAGRVRVIVRVIVTCASWRAHRST